MPAINYIPPGDDAFRAWALNFSTLITGTPAAFGLTVADANAYAALYSAYNLALLAATDPGTRTVVTVTAKNLARANLTAQSRVLAGQVQAYPFVTPSQLAALGLTVRTTVRPPIGTPVTAPILAIVGNGVLTSVIRFSDETTPDARAKPYGAVALQLWVKYGVVPPVSIADMSLLATVTRNPVQIDWPAAHAGETAYIVGRWITRRGLTGPGSVVVGTTIIAL
jgi:hypothetical protein